MIEIKWVDNVKNELVMEITRKDNCVESETRRRHGWWRVRIVGDKGCRDVQKL